MLPNLGSHIWVSQTMPFKIRKGRSHNKETNLRDKNKGGKEQNTGTYSTSLPVEPENLGGNPGSTGVPAWDPVVNQEESAAGGGSCSYSLIRITKKASK